MKTQIYHYPRPARDYKRALVTVALFAMSAAISITAIIITYVIFS